MPISPQTCLPWQAARGAMDPHAIVHLGPVKVTVEQILYVACLLSSYLFSFFYYHQLLPRKTEWVKHLYIVLVSNAFLLVCFSLGEILQIYLPILFTYALAAYFRKAWWMPVANFVAVMGVLAVAHLRRQFWQDASIDYYSLDITGPLMMVIIKLSSFAFDMRDSIIWFQKGPPRNLGASKSQQELTTGGTQAEGAARMSPTLSEGKVPSSSRQSKTPLVEPAIKNQTLRRYPSLLEFLGYVLLFPGVLTGPTMPFYEYRTFVDGTYFAGVDMTKGSLPGRKRRAFYLFLSAILFMTLYVGLQGVFTASYLLEAEFQSRPLWWRLLYVHFVNLVSRSKYYFAWMIAEGSYVIIGLGFRLSAARKPLWDRLENINPLRIETNTDFKQLVSQWNVCTNNWLHSYVYRRIQGYYGKGSSSARASLATYTVSAFWHGFYPGYYLMFVSAALLTIAARRKGRFGSGEALLMCACGGFLVVYKTIVWPFGSVSRRMSIFIPLYLLIDYMTTPFILLDWRRSIRFWASFGFFGHIFTLLLILACLIRQRVCSSGGGGGGEKRKVQ